MSDPIKLRVETSGTAEAAKAVNEVAKATENAAKAGADSGRVAEGAMTTVRAQNAAMGETTRALVEQTKAARESTKATVEESAAMTKLEREAKRAGDAVERLALAKGKSAEVAANLGTNAFEAVASGRSSPAAAVWSARSGLAAEAAALKDMAAEAARAASRVTAAKGAVDGIVPSVRKWGAANAETLRTARGLAEAFLPNILVSRVISMGGALLGMLGGLSTAVLAVGGAGAAVAAGGAYYFWRRMKDAEDSARSLTERIEAQADAIEKAGERYDDFKRAGIIMGDAAKAYEEVTKSSEGYAFSLEHMRDASEAVAGAEQRRIALAERAAKADINLDYARKIAAAGTPEEKRSLETQRDALLSGEKAKADAARAASEEKRAAAEVSVGFSDQVTKGEKLRAAREAMARLELDKASREADLRGRVLPGLGMNTRALDDEDPARRATLMDQNIADAKESSQKLRAEMDAKGKDDPTKVTDADRDKLVNLSKMIVALTTYKKALADIADAEAKADAAEKEHMKTREKFIDLVARMNEATEARKIGDKEAAAETVQRGAAQTEAQKAVAKAAAERQREASAQTDAEGFAKKNWNFANTRGEDFGLAGADAEEFSGKTVGLARNLRGYYDADKATPGELGETAAILTELIAIVKTSEASRGERTEQGQMLIRELPKMRAEIEQIKRMAEANNRRAAAERGL